MSLLKNKNRKEGDQSRAGKLLTSLGGPAGALDGVSKLAGKGAELVKSFKKDKGSDSGMSFGDQPAPTENKIFGMPPIAAYTIITVVGLILVVVAFKIASKK